MRDPRLCAGAFRVVGKGKFMSGRGNTEVAQLRQQMASMAPGLLEGAAEKVAPVATKLLGYAELIKAVLPALGAATERGAASRRFERPAPPPPPPPPRPVVVHRSGWSWKARLLTVGLSFGLGAGAAVYAASRFGAPSSRIPSSPVPLRRARRAPPG